jgi:hypothetical protein
MSLCTYSSEDIVKLLAVPCNQLVYASHPLRLVSDYILSLATTQTRTLR